MKIINTHTGKIFVDTEQMLEFLTVGDYGKENNIKADFLGLHKEINGVKNTAVDLTKKMGSDNQHSKRMFNELRILRLPQSRV